MHADVVVSRELKSLQEELSASQRERSAAPAAASGTTAAAAGPVKQTGLIAVFGLGMANVAGFYALQTTMGAVWAAAVVAAVDLLIATLVLFIAANSRPGPEADLALDVRKMAVDSLQADARDLKLMVEAFTQEIRDAKTSLVGLMHNPLQKLLIPAALSIIRGLHAKKEHG